jgi:hypothetical protein
MKLLLKKKATPANDQGLPRRGNCQISKSELFAQGLTDNSQAMQWAVKRWRRWKQTTERWCEAEVNRTAGEIALLSSEPDAAKAQVYFERAMAIAREQQEKSWELRGAMGMVRRLAWPGEAEASSRPTRSGLRLVHWRGRHARLERGWGLARRVARMTRREFIGLIGGTAT